MVMRKERKTKKYASGGRLMVMFIIFAFISTLVLSVPGIAGETAGTKELNYEGSLPDYGKRINELIYPTFGYPAIMPRGSEVTLEFDVRKSDPNAPMPELENWQVYIVSSIARNKSTYHPNADPPYSWYTYDGGSYGNYQDPVHSVSTTWELPVISTERGPSERWPLIFDQAEFVVDRITVEVPYHAPQDLYDVGIWCEEVGGPGTYFDTQPHGLQVIDEYKSDINIVQISDTHVFGQEIESIFLDYSSFTMREPRPNCPLRWKVWPFTTFVPHDDDGDGVDNEGALYLQQQIQAINLIDPDFVVFTGDGVFGQKNFDTHPGDKPETEYRFEYLWLYDELLALNIPIYMVPGNHDGYCWDGHEVSHDDGLEIWQDLFGPIYYSWDYGDQDGEEFPYQLKKREGLGYHFLAINTMDWTKNDRNGVGYLDYILQPDKWQGQARGSGDTWEWQPWPWGPDPGGDGFTDQLAWIEEDLAANMDRDLRGAFMHHDPFKVVGDGNPPTSWQDVSQFGIPVGGGEGEGSQALCYLFRAYDVAFEASGHEHEDYVAQVPWYNETGAVQVINTTCSEVPVGDETFTPAESINYAGYRPIAIADGQLTSWGFPGTTGEPNKWSIPSMEGITVGETSHYSTYYNNGPVVRWMEQENDPWGGDTFNRDLPLNQGAGPYQDVTCNVHNTLNQPGATLNLEDCLIEFSMARLSGGYYYVVENGTCAEQYNAPGGIRMMRVLMALPGGATVPVRVHPSDTLDETSPLGFVLIDNGAITAWELEVELTIAAQDTGGSGIMDMMISNDPNFADAEWEPYDGTPIMRDWKLEKGLPGWRTVYVRFRDAAMPGNVTEVQDSVLYRISITAKQPVK